MPVAGWPEQGRNKGTGQEDGRVFGSKLIRAFADERGLHRLVRNSVNRVARQIVMVAL